MNTPRANRWRKTSLVGLVAWTATTACASSLHIRTDYDREREFVGLHSYCWVDSATIVRDSGANPFLERRVRRAVDRALGDRGLVLAEEAPDVLVTALVMGPTRRDPRWRYWSAAPCGPVTSVWIGIGYPYGFGLRHPRWPWRSPYYRDPWGLACSYRVGFGYVWLPVYEMPPDRFAGTLVIDLIDPASRELVWRGSAEGAVPSEEGESLSQEELDTIAAEILRDFPPR